MLCIGHGAQPTGYALTSNYNIYGPRSFLSLGEEDTNTDFFVVRITFGEGNRDRVEVFRNPESLVNEDTCVADAELTGKFAFDRVSLGNFHGAKVHEVDEIRVGTTFRAVTGVTGVLLRGVVVIFDGELLMRLATRFDNLKAMLVLAALATASPVFGASFNDATGENFDGNAHMDISSVQVTDDGTNITFKISVSAADITMPNWGKYVVGIDTNSATGDTLSPVGNPWGRNISMADGMDAWIGSWVDSGGGFQPWSYSGGMWTQNGIGAPVISGNMTTITTSLASLGLAAGQSFQFDVYTTGGGGGDSANDALANPAQTVNDWQVPYRTPAGGGLRYTTVPEPASIVLICGAMVAGLGRIRGRK